MAAKDSSPEIGLLLHLLDTSFEKHVATLTFLVRREVHLHLRRKRLVVRERVVLCDRRCNENERE